MSKGAGRRPRAISLADEASKWEAAFGKRGENEDLDPETQAVRYKQDPKSGKLVPDFMWAQYDMLPRETVKTAFIQRDTTVEYVSDVTGKVVSGRRAHRYDLHSTGSRVYEGRKTEQQEADNYKAHEEKKLMEAIDKSLPETLNDIKYGNNPPSEQDKNGDAKISWTF